MHNINLKFVHPILVDNCYKNKIDKKNEKSFIQTEKLIILIVFMLSE